MATCSMRLGPNTTDDRRLGAAIRYIKPSMKAQSGPETEVTLVAGEDRFGHFTLTDPPKGTLLDEDLAAVARDVERRESVLFAGADNKGHRRS